MCVKKLFFASEREREREGEREMEREERKRERELLRICLLTLYR